MQILFKYFDIYIRSAPDLGHVPHGGGGVRRAGRVLQAQLGAGARAAGAAAAARPGGRGRRARARARRRAVSRRRTRGTTTRYTITTLYVQPV